MTLGKYLVKRFVSLAAQNNKAYVELLFWKNVGAVREMTEGYTKEWVLFFFFTFCLHGLNTCVHVKSFSHVHCSPELL